MEEKNKIHPRLQRWTFEKLQSLKILKYEEKTIQLLPNLNTICIHMSFTFFYLHLYKLPFIFYIAHQQGFEGLILRKKVIN